ncbi:MAG: hypothetical protein AMXMBFR58_21580 [Phycisphaerae bacterium]
MWEREAVHMPVVRIPRYNPLMSMYVGVLLVFISFAGFAGLRGWQRFVPGGISLVWLVVRLRGNRLERLVDRLDETDGWFCLKCWYDLNDLGDSGVCPECGEPFSAKDLDEAREILEAALAKRMRGNENNDWG